jgi:hypothetical protein
MIINLRSSLINTSSLSLYINIYVVVAMYSSREEKKKKEIGHCIHASDL